ncbi:restriction endonuclease subunit S [Streptococcus pseudopneumoniae]|uniref:Type IC specificity subunit n=1 Tax=Streptococcus pseudopneumoniae TaxID=257758 RepID=A0A0T8UHS9_9STRE|nr:restriction endonuclease subunit S [Streptococcus pseudopneumoniae]CKB25798.1 type IC specificity subunit [Streptococcus pseudopneumoniae]
MTKQPSYRFVRYTEPWEEKKLSDGISKIGDGIHGTPVYSEDGDYYFINGNNLVDGKIFLFPETKKVQSNQLTVSDTSLKKNTILMSINGTIGSLAWYRDEKVMLGKSVAYLTTEEFDRKFIYSILQAPKIVKHFNNNLTGTTIKNLGLKTIRDTVISLPSLPEQTAIGSFFQDIDQLISLQQRKLEVLKEQKKTYLKLLFPARGQTKPALRFAGFEDDWKEVKLGEVCSIKGGNAWKSEHYSTDGKYLVVTISNVKGNEYIDDTYGNRIDTVESQFILEQGDILISLTGNVGRVSKMTEVAAVLNQRVGKLATNQSNNFLFTLLSNRNFEKEMVLSSQGAAQANISNNDVLNYKTSFPSLPEQEAIGSFFQDLDKAIAKQEEKVNQLKESKQTLLRKMFI